LPSLRPARLPLRPCRGRRSRRSSRSRKPAGGTAQRSFQRSARRSSALQSRPSTRRPRHRTISPSYGEHSPRRSGLPCRGELKVGHAGWGTALLAMGGWAGKTTAAVGRSIGRFSAFMAFKIRSRSSWLGNNKSAVRRSSPCQSLLRRILIPGMRLTRSMTYPPRRRCSARILARHRWDVTLVGADDLQTPTAYWGQLWFDSKVVSTYADRDYPRPCLKTHLDCGGSGMPRVQAAQPRIPPVSISAALKCYSVARSHESDHSR
jgi:hypothetical protein